MKRAIVLALALAMACAPEGRVRVLSPDELPSDLYASPSPTPTAAPARDVLVWFVRDARLVPVVRQATGTGNPVEFALRELLEGPTPPERQQGLETAVPDEAELLEVSVDGSVVTVNLSKEFELGAEQNVLLLRLGQVVYTATELSYVGRVRFLIDSEPAGVIGQDGATHEEVGRGDYVGLVARSASPTPEA